MAKPPWLHEIRDFCRRSGISVVAWGPNLLTVEAKSTTRASEIANQLGQLGFKVVKDEDDEHAGLLSLSRNPDAVQPAIQRRTAMFDISRRRWPERVEPLIWLIGSFFLVPGVTSNAPDVGGVRLHSWPGITPGVFLRWCPHLGMAA